MKILKYDNDSRLADIIKINEAYRQKYRPNEPELDIHGLKLMIKTHWPKTVLERDVLYAITDEGEPIGAIGLFKPEKEEKWVALMIAIPEFETEELWDKLLTRILDLAKEQNAPELHFQSSKDSTLLNRTLSNRNIIPNHYIYSLQLNNYERIQEISIPKGITIKKSTKMEDITQFISVMNDAYKNVPEWTPETEEIVQKLEKINRKNFTEIYYLAYEGNEMVGACNVLDTLKETKPHLISGLGVATDHQKRGIGGALMYSVLQDFKSKRRKNVMFNVTGNNVLDIKLPTKFGFQEDLAKTTMVYSIKPSNW